MAYDRYDTRRGRESARHADYERGRRDERGFFERAGDEIASWFGDDDRERSRDRLDRDYDERGSSRYRADSDFDDRSRRWQGSGFSSERGFAPSRSSGYRPTTGDYGRFEDERGRLSDRSPGAWGSRADRPTGGREHDRHYQEWRQRQLEELDRDYDEYHRERQRHFEEDFGSWRQTRQQKRQMLGQVREHMDVVGKDGETLGKVDKVAGDRVILTRSDSPDGRHHSIPCTLIDRVEGDQLVLDCTADRAKEQWRDDSRERALFEREDQGEAGPQALDRSFSGTYRD